MDDEKPKPLAFPQQKKPLHTPPSMESDVLKVIEKSRIAAEIAAQLTLQGPVPKGLIYLAEGKAAQQTQLHFLKDNGKGFLTRESPEYAKAFDRAIKPMPVSDPAHRTSALLVVDESTDNNLSHAYNTGSVAYHAARVSTGINPPPVLRINRYVYPKDKQKIIPNWMKDDTSISFPNYVQAEEKALYRASDYVIISNSTHIVDDALVSEEFRKKEAAYLREYYGPNVIFVNAAGNEHNHQNSLSKLPHNTVQYDSRSMRVGAAEEFTVQDHFGPPITAYKLENYSSLNANIVSLVSPLDAKKAVLNEKPEQFLGTSSATPRFGGEVVLPLIEAFAYSNHHPKKIHTADTILAAIKLTAKPMWVRTGPITRTYIKNGETVNEHSPDDIIYNNLSGEHYYSPEAGPGLTQRERAADLLQKQMEYAKIHPASNIPLVDKAYPLLAPMQHSSNPDGQYAYKITVADDLLTNSITLGLRSGELFKEKREGSNRWEEAAALFLVSPDGKQRLRIYPTKSTEHANGFSIAETSGFLLAPTKGEWTLQSSVPLQEIYFSLNSAIPKGHFLDKIRPDFARMHKEALQHEDFSRVKDSSIKRLEEIPLETFDLSQTVLPNGYMNLRLLREMANERYDAAKKVVESNYRGFAKNRQTLLHAVEEKDFRKLVGMVEKNGQPQFSTFEMATHMQNHVLIKALLSNGYADIHAPSEGKRFRESNSPAEVLVASHDLPNRTELLKLAFANGAKMEDRTLLEALKVIVYFRDSREESIKVFKYLVEEQEGNLYARDYNREPITFGLTGQPELLEYVLKREPALSKATSNQGETLLQKLLSTYSASESEKQSLIKLAARGEDLTEASRYDRHGWLDEAITTQQHIFNSKALTSTQILQHELTKKPAEITAAIYLLKDATNLYESDRHKKIDLATDKERLLLAPLPLSKNKDGEYENTDINISIKKEGQHIYLPLKNGTAVSSFSTLPKQADITIIIAPEDISKLRIGVNDKATSISIGNGKALLRGSRDKDKGQEIDLNCIRIGIGTVQDGKAHITHQLPLKELIEKRDALLKAARPAHKEEPNKKMDNTLSAVHYGQLIPSIHERIVTLSARNQTPG